MPRRKPKTKPPDRRKPLPTQLVLTRDHMRQLEDLPGFARDHLRSADALVARIEGLAVALGEAAEKELHGRYPWEVIQPKGQEHGKQHRRAIGRGGIAAH